MGSSKNAIERRLAEIEDHWNAFAENPTPRFLRWLGKRDDLSMVDVYVDWQCDESGQSPDLFIKLDTPFEDADTYGRSLVASLVQQYEETSPGLNEEGIATPWKLLEDPTDSDHRAFARACISFRESHPDWMDRLALYLSPVSISDPDAFEKWIYRFIAGNMPETIRVMAVDDVAAPILARLAERVPDKVTTVPLDLNMPAALSELARGDARQAGPDSILRQHMVGLSNAAGRRDLEGCHRECEAAIALCKREGWPHLGTVALLMLGSAQVGAERPDLALDTYARSRRAAEAAGKLDQPEAPNLLLQSVLAEASCRVQMGDWQGATADYQAAVPLAESTENWIIAYESARMLSVCQQQQGDSEATWNAAGKALLFADKIEPDVRRQTTLPGFGRSLLEQFGQDSARREKIESRMTRLVGNDWASLA